jgi:hypothetical protein
VFVWLKAQVQKVIVILVPVVVPENVEVPGAVPPPDTTAVCVAVFVHVLVATTERVTVPKAVCVTHPVEHTV